jgi:hypothetical protein
MLMSFHGFPPDIGPEIDLRYRPVGGVEISGRIAIPFSTGELRNQLAGTATLGQGLGIAYVGYRFGSDDSPLRPAVAAGAGIYWLAVTGHGLNGLAEHHKDSASVAPSVEADLEMRFHERVRGRIGVSALFPLPEPVVIIGDQEAGRAGQPMLLGTLGVGVTL